MFGIEALTSAMMHTLPGGELNSEPTGGYWGGGGETLTAAAAARSGVASSWRLKYTTVIKTVHWICVVNDFSVWLPELARGISGMIIV